MLGDYKCMMMGMMNSKYKEYVKLKAAESLQEEFALNV